MITIPFKFSPLEYVNVSLYGLHYAGRVIRCIYDGGKNLYLCDYNCDGDLKNREFYEDELQKARGEHG